LKIPVTADDERDDEIEEELHDEIILSDATSTQQAKWIANDGNTEHDDASDLMR